MKFLVCQKMIGEGCDYTIGCGMTFDYIDAPSIKKAIDIAIFPPDADGENILEGEHELEEVLIIPAKHILTVDIEKILAEINAETEAEHKKEYEDREKAELKRLQSKYDK